jgi:hypothetical protein
MLMLLLVLLLVLVLVLTLLSIAFNRVSSFPWGKVQELGSRGSVVKQGATCCIFRPGGMGGYGSLDLVRTASQFRQTRAR